MPEASLALVEPLLKEDVSRRAFWNGRKALIAFITLLHLAALNPAITNVASQPTLTALRSIGNTVLQFGKHRGRTFADLKENDPSYCSWALERTDPSPRLKEFVDYLKAEVGEGPVASWSRSRLAMSGGLLPGTESDKVVSFGKHRGRTFADVKANEPDYVSWALKQTRSPGSGLREFIDYLKAEGVGESLLMPRQTTSDDSSKKKDSSIDSSPGADGRLPARKPTRKPAHEPAGGAARKPAGGVAAQENLSPSIDNALLRELTRTWAEINAQQFKGAMKAPSLRLDETKRRLGSWQTGTRTLSLSRRLVQDHLWQDVIEVLRHEMAHQYVEEVLEIRDETAHGPTFRQVCAERAINWHSTMKPTVDNATAKVMEKKVNQLLALAGSDNEHEAENSMRAAHRLIRKHNVDLTASHEPSAYQFSQISEVRNRFTRHEKILAGILGEHFFVQAIWVNAYRVDSDTHGRALEICGRPENLAIATHVYRFMLETAERLWLAHKSANAIRGRAVASSNNYRAGLMIGFSEKLKSEAASAEETGLVWLGDAGLQDYFSLRHPSIRKAYRGRKVTVDSAWNAGRAEGHRVVLNKPIETRSEGTRGLLGPG